MYRKSALELRDAVVNRELSVTAITEYFYHRIESHDEQIGAFLFSL